MCLYVLCYAIRYDFRINTMFGSSLPPAVCSVAHVSYLRYLSLLACSGVVFFVLFCFVFWLLVLFLFYIFACLGFCFVFLFVCLSSSCVPNFACFSGLSIFDSPVGVLKRLCIVKHVKLNRIQHFTTYMRFSAV